MHKGLSTYQTKQATVRIHFLPYHAYPTCYSIVQYVGKTALLRQKSQQTQYYYRIASKLAKAYQ